MFNFKEYGSVIDSYKDAFSTGEKILVYLTVGVLVIAVIVLIILFVLFVRKMVRKVTNELSKDQLLNEIANLNDQVNERKR